MGLGELLFANPTPPAIICWPISYCDSSPSWDSSKICSPIVVLSIYISRFKMTICVVYSLLLIYIWKHLTSMPKVAFDSKKAHEASTYMQFSEYISMLQHTNPGKILWCFFRREIWSKQGYVDIGECIIHNIWFCSILISFHLSHICQVWIKNIINEWLECLQYKRWYIINHRCPFKSIFFPTLRLISLI